MSQIRYRIKKGTITEQAGATYGDTPEELAESVVGDLSLAIEVEVGGVTMHLAGWLDPDHWESDWNEVLNGESFEEYAARCVEA